MKRIISKCITVGKILDYRYDRVEIMNAVQKLRRKLKGIADPQRAKLLQRYFKTGKGEYAEGDIFLGITVPQSRKIAIKFQNLDFASIEILLKSKFHEERLIALLILTCKFNNKDYHTNILENIRIKKKIYDFYLKNTKYINNWDLVDLSAPKIVGSYLCGLSRPNQLLIKLAKSKNIWERRIAVLSTFQFIKYNRFAESLEIAEILLQDKHDLLHKAVGWMLREIGKRDFKMEIKFLEKHYQKMPRTMLRYAIERFPEKLRITYLNKI